MAVGVELHGGIEVPARHEARRAEDEDIGKALRQQHVVRRHALIAEAVALGDADAKRLGARVRVEHARDHAGAELVRVGDAVDAGELVLGEQRVEVEILRCRVEVRQVLLSAIRRVDVKEPRLERLAHGAAEQFGLAFERPGAVEADGRDHP